MQTEGKEFEKRLQGESVREAEKREGAAQEKIKKDK